MSMKPALTAFCLASAAVLTACGQTRTASDLTARIDMPTTANDDVQTLQAWISGLARDTVVIAARDGGPYGITIDSRTCQDISATELDCSEPLRSLSRVHGEQSPLLHRLIVSKALLRQGYEMSCRKVEMRTVIKKSALESPVTAGIGFFVDKSARQETSGLQYRDGHEVWIAKGDLHAVGETTLKSGEAAVVHRFIDASFCGVNGGFSGEFLAKGRYAFKPYVQYDVQDGADVNVYKQWEAVQGNHLLDYSGRYSFDRQADLLTQ